MLRNNFKLNTPLHTIKDGVQQNKKNRILLCMQRTDVCVFFGWFLRSDFSKIRVQCHVKNLTQKSFFSKIV